MTERIELQLETVISGLSELQKIGPALESAFASLEKSTQDGVLKFGFDEATLKRVESVVNSLKQAFKDATKNIPKQVEVEFVVSDESISKMKNRIENGIQQAMSQIGSSIGASVSRSQSRSKPSSGIRESTGNIFQDTSNDIQAIKELEANAARLSNTVEYYNKAIRQATANTGAFVQELRAGFNNLSSGGPVSFIETTARKSLADLRAYQRELSNELAGLNKRQQLNREALANGTITERAYRVSNSLIDDQIAKIIKLAVPLENNIRLQERGIANARRARTEEFKAVEILKTSESLKRRFIELTAKGGVATLSEARAFTDQFQRTGQLLTESLKRNANLIGEQRSEIALTEAEIEKYRRQVLDTNQALKNLRQGDNESKEDFKNRRSKLVAERDIIRQTIKDIEASNNGRRETVKLLEESAAAQQKERVIVSGITETVREQSRVLQEQGKIRERAIKGAERLAAVTGISTKAAQAAFQRSNALQGSQIDDGTKEAVAESIRYLNQLKAKYRETEQAIISLREEQRKQVSQVERDAANFTNEFSVFKKGDGTADTEGALKQLDNRIDQIENSFDRMTKSASSDLESLGNQISEQSSILKKQDADIKVFDRLTDKLAKTKTTAESVRLRFKEIFKEVVNLGSTAQAQLSFEKLKKAETEVKSLDVSINKLRADIAQAGVAGNNMVSQKMLDDLNSLVKKRQLLSSVLSDPVYTKNAAQLKFLNSTINKTSGAVDEFGVKLASIKAEWNRATTALQAGGAAADEAAKDLIRIGSAAKTSAEGVREILRAYELVEQELGPLTEIQRAEVSALKQMERQFSSTDMAVKESTAVLKNYRTELKNAQTQISATASPIARAENLGRSVKTSNIIEVGTSVSDGERQLLEQSKATVSELNAKYEQLTKTQVKLRVEANLAKKELLEQSQSGTGLFSGFDESPEGAKQAAALLKSLSDEIQAEFIESNTAIDKSLKGVGDSLSKIVPEMAKLESRVSVFDKISDDVAKADAKLVNLNTRLKDVKNAINSVSTTETMKAAIDGFGKAESEARQLDVQIKKLVADIQNAKASGDAGVADDLINQVISLKGRQSELNQVLRDPAILENIRNQKFMAAQLKVASDAQLKYSNDIHGSRLEMARAQDELKKGGIAATAAAKDILSLGTAARSSANDIGKALVSLELLERAGHSLSAQEKRQRADLQALQAEYRKTANDVLSNERALKQLEAAGRRTGQGFRFYTDELASSIRQNFKFINAMTVVTSVLFGVRAAFTQLLEESRALSRTMTVMQSDTKSFEEVFASLKDTVRATAIEFGERIEVVAEVVKQFGSAGFTAEESMAALNDTMKLIVSTQADAEQSAKAVAGIYRVFGSQIRATTKSGHEFARINDVLTSVYRNHQVELDELVQGFRFSSAASKLAGFSFEETAAFLAVLNDNMIKSGAAGRGLQVTFAQTAKKADKIAEALNIQLDPGATLKENFTKLLTEVGKQLESGIATSQDLEKIFRIFGLRGARSFITLAKEGERLADTMDEVKNRSEGVSTQLAEIVKGEFAKQFESAKQSLLQFGRAALDTLMPVFVMVVDVIKQVVDLSKAFPGFTTAIVGVTGLVAILGSLALTIVAVGQVLAVLKVDLLSAASSTFRYTLSVKDSILALLGQQTAAQAAAIATAQDAAAKNVAAGATSRLTTVTKGLTAAVSANPWIAAATALLAIVVALSAVMKSTRELKQEVVDLSNELNKLGTDKKKLDGLTKSMDGLKKAVDNGSLSAAVASKKIISELGKVNDDLIQKSDILSMSQDEIAGSIDKVTAKINRRADAQRALNKLTAEAAEDQLKQTRADLFTNSIADVQAGAEDFVKLKGLRLGFSLDNAVIYGDLNEEAVSKLQEASRDITVQGLKDSFNQVKRTIDNVFGNTNFGGLASALNRQQTLQDVVNIEGVPTNELKFLQTELNNTNKAVNAAAIAFLNLDDDARDAQLGLLKASGALNPKQFNDFVKLIENGGVALGKLEIPQFQDPDIQLQSWERIYEIFESFQGPLDQNAFAGLIGNTDVVITQFERLDALQKSFNVAALRPDSGEFVGPARFADPNATANFQLEFDTEAGQQALRENIEEVIQAAINSYDPKTQQEEIYSLKKALFAANPSNKGLSVAEALERLRENVPFSARALESFATSADGSISLTSEKIYELAKTIGLTTEESKKLEQALVKGIFNAKRINDIGGLGKSFDTLIEQMDSSIRKANELNGIIGGFNKSKLIRQQVELEIRANVPAVDRDQTVKELAKITERELKAASTQLDVATQKLKQVTDAGDTERLAEAQEEYNSALKNTEELTEIVYSRKSKLGEATALERDTRNKINAENKELRKQFILLGQFQKATDSNLGSLLQEQRLNATLLVDKVKLLKRNREITGSYTSQQAALADLTSTLRDNLDLQRQINKALNEEAALRFEVLADIEAILNTTETYAELEARVFSSAAKISDVNERLNLVQGKGLEQQSKRVELYKELIDEIGNAFDLEKKLTELKKKKEEYLSNEVDLLKELIGLYGGIEDTIGAELSSQISRNLDLQPFITASQIAAATGEDLGSVIYDVSAATERLQDGLLDGSISANQLTGSLQSLALEYVKVSEGQKVYEDQLKELSQQSVKEAREAFRTLLEAGKLDEAAAALDRLKTAGADLYGLDGVDQDQIARVQEQLALQRELNDALANESDVVIKISLIEDTNLADYFDLLRERVRSVKEELQELSKVNVTENLSSVAQGVTVQGFGQVEDNIDELKKSALATEKASKEIYDLVRDGFKKTLSLEQFQKALITAAVTVKLPGMNSGGRIPGYGGGDSIPAMLEPGEFVIPKEMVAKYGPSYFEALRTGRVKGFAEGTPFNGLAPTGIASDLANLGAAIVDGIVSPLKGFISESKAAPETGTISGLGNIGEAIVGGIVPTLKDLIREAQNFSNESKAAAAKLSREVNASATRLNQRGTDAEKFAATVEKAFESINSTRLNKFVFDAVVLPFQDGLSAIGSFLAEELDSISSAALNNAEALQALRDQMAAISAEYQRVVDDAVLALKRNETSYYQYLNALEDAERARIEAQIAAEEAYREAVITSAELIKESFSKALDGTVASVSSLVGRISSDYLSAALDSAAADFASLQSGTLLETNRDAGLTGLLKDAFTGIQGAFETNEFSGNQFTDFFLEVGPSIEGFFEEFDQHLLDLGSGLLILGEQLSQLGIAAAGLAFEEIINGLTSVAQLGLTEDPQASADAMVAFIEGLPESAVLMVDTFVEEFPRIMDALAEALPAVIDSLAEGLPTILETFVDSLSESLPKIVDALVRAIPILVRQLTPLIIDLILLLAKEIPKVIGALAESLPILIKEIIKKLPEIIATLAVATLELIPKLIGGFFSGLFGFSSGGPVPGGYGGGDTIPAMLEPGEFVIPKHIVRELGSPFFENIRQGNLQPSSMKVQGLRTGGLVGDRRSQFSFAPSGATGNNTAINTVNTVNVNPQLTGRESDAEILDRAELLADAIDQSLARKVEDRDSRLARSLR